MGLLKYVQVACHGHSYERLQQLRVGGAMQGVPEDSPVVFEMELVGFQRQQHWTSLAAADKIRRAQVRPQSAASGLCTPRVKG